MTTIGLEEARRILGDRVLGPEEIVAALGGDPLAALAPSEREVAARIPYDTAVLEAAKVEDCMLVLRVTQDADGPLTIMRLDERFAGGIDPCAHTGVGYELRDEWTIGAQPFATTEHCAPGWTLVRRTPLPATVNKTRQAQEAVLPARSPSSPPSRRSAVEIVYDTLLWHHARGERLLGDAWDWSRSASTDGGFAAVGNFDDAGLRIVAYSPAVRFGTLGVCTQR